MEQGKRKPGLVKEVTRLSSFPNTATSLGEENRFDKGNITLAKETLIPMRKPTIVGSMGREQRTGAEIFNPEDWGMHRGTIGQIWTSGNLTAQGFAARRGVHMKGT